MVKGSLASLAALTIASSARAAVAVPSLAGARAWTAPAPAVFAALAPGQGLPAALPGLTGRPLPPGVPALLPAASSPSGAGLPKVVLPDLPQDANALPAALDRLYGERASFSARPPVAAGLAPDERAALDRVRLILSRGGAVAASDKAFLNEWLPVFMRKGLIGEAPDRSTRSMIERWFPKLAEKRDWRITADECAGYNCIAWTVGSTDEWLWPGDRVEDFDAFYRGRGLVPLKTGESDEAADVALMGDGDVLHGLRRVVGQWWESKLGGYQRILHRLHELESRDYGKVLRFYRKALPGEL